MTIHEFKAKIFKEKFILAERLSETMQNGVEIALVKFDTDGMRLESLIHMPLYHFENDSYTYLSTLQEMYNRIVNYQNNRHNKDITTCQHKETLLGNKIKCAYCMADLGEQMTYRMMDN